MDKHFSKGQRLLVKTDMGMVEGDFFAMNSEHTKISLKNVATYPEGKKMSGLVNFFKNEVIDVLLLEAALDTKKKVLIPEDTFLIKNILSQPVQQKIYTEQLNNPTSHKNIHTSQNPVNRHPSVLPTEISAYLKIAHSYSYLDDVDKSFSTTAVAFLVEKEMTGQEAKFTKSLAQTLKDVLHMPKDLIFERLVRLCFVEEDNARWHKRPLDTDLECQIIKNVPYLFLLHEKLLSVYMEKLNNAISINLEVREANETERKEIEDMGHNFFAQKMQLLNAQQCINNGYSKRYSSFPSNNRH